MTSSVEEVALEDIDVPAAQNQDQRASRLVEMLRSHWPVVALGVLAIAVSVVAHHLLYPAYSYNRDEPVYLWMARHLQAGVLTPTDGGFPQFFHPWLAASRHGVYFTHFTIGWPAILVGSNVIFGSPDAAPAFGALLAVAGTYALALELTFDRKLAIVASAAMVASPILAVQGGTYLGYLFTTGVGLLFSAAFLYAFRRRRPGMFALAGTLLSVIFLTRPFDALLWASAVGGYIAFFHRDEKRELLRVAGWVFLGAIPGLIVSVVYNHAISGSFLSLPNGAADPLDKFGFGLRRMMPAFDRAMYGKRLAVTSTLKDGVRLPLFLVGSYLGLAAAWVGLWLRRRDRTTIALLAIIGVFPVAYFFHWGAWVSSLVATWGGPIYFMPLYGPLCILIATSVLALWQRWRFVGVLLVLVLVGTTIPVGLSRMAAARRLSLGQQPWKTSGESIKGRALVFVADSSAYLMIYNPFAANDPKLTGRVLYATDRGPANLDLLRRMSDRTPYLQRASLPDDGLSVPGDVPARFPPGELQPMERPPVPTVTLTKMRVVTGAQIELRLRIRNASGQRVVNSFIDQGNSRTRQWRTITKRGTKGGVVETTWTVGSSGSGTGSAGAPDVRLHGPHGTIVVGVAFGPTAESESAKRPAARQLLSFAVTGRAAEVLTPSRPEVRKRTKDGPWGWFQDSRAIIDRAGAPPNLDIAVVPGSVGY